MTVGDVERQQRGGGRVMEDVVHCGHVGVVTEPDAVVKVWNVI